ncbi:hypothetical protein OAP18_00135 [Gammaproteobacteria bacterium]|nr:hypothetical protein [Gammaproteobacteria bacterium]
MTTIETEELQALMQRIISSSELGRSRTYADILSYLVECSINGNTPKEIAIAIDVLGREADFDVAKDSIVRVHIYHLRKKLKAYFANHGKREKYRIDIPKGQYIITTTLNEAEDDQAALSVTGKKLSRESMTPWLVALVVVLLIVNVFQQFSPSTDANSAVEARPFAELGPWQAMLDDQTPIMIVIGDYYIFGELDESGNVTRMVREFDINSQQDLESAQSESQRAAVQNYFNLDLSYIPTSSAFALAQIMPVFADDAERITVKMMSSLTTADLAANHIIYLGYLSGLGSLHDLMFAASDLSIGVTYDELFNLETDDYYNGSSGLSIGENSFQDYGMITTFPSPNNNQFLLIAGMRDEGLINVSQEVTNPTALRELEQSLVNLDAGAKAYEALYEVFGFDSTNFDADLVYSKTLDTEVIWEARLIGNQGR